MPYVIHLMQAVLELMIVMEPVHRGRTVACDGHKAGRSHDQLDFKSFFVVVIKLTNGALWVWFAENQKEMLGRGEATVKTSNLGNKYPQILKMILILLNYCRILNTWFLCVGSEQ